MKLQMDSPFVQAGIKMTNLLIVNLCWVLGSLPLVTVGASTIAANTVLLRMVENREDVGIFRAFWRAWVQNLGHGVVLTLLLGAAAYSTWMSWQLFEKLPDNPLGFLILAIVIIFLAIVHFVYVFSLEARYKNTIVRALQNSRMICMKYYLKTLGLIGILAVQAAFFLLVSPVITYVGIFVWPALAMYTTCQIALPVFRELEGNAYADDGFSSDAERDW